MRAYACVVVGLPYEGRARYCADNVHVGDGLTLHREPDNPHDCNAVAVHHGRVKIGYIAADEPWVCRSLDEGDSMRATRTWSRWTALTAAMMESFRA
jgi:hypothetical protein